MIGGLNYQENTNVCSQSYIYSRTYKHNIDLGIIYDRIPNITTLGETYVRTTFIYYY